MLSQWGGLGEVEVEDGFPDPSIAAQKITSIAIHDDVADQYTVFVLGDLVDKKQDNVKIKPNNVVEKSNPNLKKDDSNIKNKNMYFKEIKNIQKISQTLKMFRK